MTSANTSTQQELQDQFLAIVRKGQEIALDAIKSMVDSVSTITPKIPTVDVPFADQLPKPQDVVASGYDFAQQLLTSQRNTRHDEARRSKAKEARPWLAPPPRTCRTRF